MHEQHSGGAPQREDRTSFRSHSLGDGPARVCQADPDHQDSDCLLVR